MVAAGQYSNHIDHYNTLRTIEDMYGLPYAGNASSPITNCWKSNIIAARSIIAESNSASSAGVNKVSVYPNPATSWINFSLSELPSSPVLIRIFDMIGRLKGEYEMSKTQNFKNSRSNLQLLTSRHLRTAVISPAENFDIFTVRSGRGG